MLSPTIRLQPAQVEWCYKPNFLVTYIKQISIITSKDYNKIKCLFINFLNLLATTSSSLLNIGKKIKIPPTAIAAGGDFENRLPGGNVNRNTIIKIIEKFLRKSQALNKG